MTTKASTVCLNDGDTSYSISLDGVDMALLPMDKLLNKYSGNQQTAIWSLDTYSKDLEYLNDWDDEFCQFEVEAMKTPEPMKNCIFCHICQINVPKTHIEEHNDSEGHSAMLKMAFRATDRINKHMMQEKNSDSLVNVPSEEQSYYYCTTCNMFVDLSDTNHHNEVEHRTSLKRHKLYSKIYEKYEQLGEEENRNETFEGLDVTKKTDLKDTHESQGLNTKPSITENIEINKQSDLKCDKKSKSRKDADRYCRVCDIYVPNNKYNLKEHYNGKTHKTNLVANENQLIETASETRRADVLVTKSDVATTSNTNSVATASATRNYTTVHSNQTNGDKAADKLLLIFIDFVHSRAIKIFDNSGVSILVKWWSWHGFNVSHDFYDSGYVTCELCEINVPFEHIYSHVTDKSHKRSTAQQVYNGMRGQNFCLVCRTKENVFKHRVSFSHIKNMTEAVRLAYSVRANEYTSSQLANEEIERQLLSSNSLIYIKAYYQRYVYNPSSKHNKSYDEFGIHEISDIFTKSGEMIQLWKMNYHSLECQVVRNQDAFWCLLCQEGLLPEHARRHVSSQKHLDRVIIPFTDDQNCIRRFEYSPMKFGYHCAHCNLLISTNEGLSRHVYSICHQNRLKTRIFQRYGGEWRLKEEIRLRTEWLQKTKKGRNKGKWLCLVIIGAVLTYRFMKVRQVPSPTEFPTSYGNHFMNSISLFDCS